MGNEPGAIPGWVNPLKWIQADETFGDPTNLSFEAVLDFLTIPGSGHQIEDFLSRHKEISSSEDILFFVPAHEEIMQNLIWSLRHAKASYLLANYIGTIALCGIVVEMLAQLLFDISGLRLGPSGNEETLSQNAQEKLFGRSFERLSQERRIDVLKVIGEIDDTDYALFNEIKAIRNKYLHFRLISEKELQERAKDARETYWKATRLVKRCIGLKISTPGHIELKPKLVFYLRERRSST